MYEYDINYGQRNEGRNEGQNYHGELLECWLVQQLERQPRVGGVIIGGRRHLLLYR